MYLGEWRRFLAALLLVVGIVLSPLRAVAATVPIFFAYDVTVQPTARAFGRTDAVRPQGGALPEYAYDAVHVEYDGAANPHVVAHAVAIRACGPALNFRNRREVGESVIYDASAATTAAEGLASNAANASSPRSRLENHDHGR